MAAPRGDFEVKVHCNVRRGYDREWLESMCLESMARQGCRCEIVTDGQERLAARDRQGVDCTITEIQLGRMAHTFSIPLKRPQGQSRLGFIERSNLGHEQFDQFVQQGK